MNTLGLNIKRQLIGEELYPVKATYDMTPEYITVHNTANNAAASGEIAYMVSNDNYVSYHWAVDDIEAIQAIPHNRNAWHCGDGAEGNGNRKSVGVEICHSLDPNNPRYAQSEENGAKLVAILMHELGLGLDRVVKHQDWSGKYCPHRILDNNGWDAFKQKVARYYDEIAGGETVTSIPVQNTSSDRVAMSGIGTVKVSKLNVRDQPNTTSSSVMATYGYNDIIYFDSYVVANGYHWISYISRSGVRRFVASGTANGNGSNKEYINF